MILVVDDSPDVLRSLEVLLKLDGYAVTTATSGAAAMKLLDGPLPHCVLLDFHMPGLSGLDVLKNIRADPRLKHINVIIFSAGASYVRRLALDAGADAFVEKASLDFGLLERTVRRFCQPSVMPSPIRWPGRAPEKGAS